MESLDEWGLGGRGFGTLVTWFLLGGDLYTAYTFVAVPAAMFATGAVSGFFAVPYTIVVYPIIFVFMSRLWSVSPPARLRDAGRLRPRPLRLARPVPGGRGHRHPRDDALHRPAAGRHRRPSSRSMGLGGNSALASDLPLLIAFAVLAAYTYSCGLRAPAMIAFVKDGLIYLVIVVAIIYLPHKLGGWGHDLRRGPDEADQDQPGHRQAGRRVHPGPGAASRRTATLALGSAMALFMYPHSVTAVLSTKNRNIVRRNAAILPAYSLRCSACSRCSASWRSRPERQADRPGRPAEPAAGRSRSCSRTSSRPGSPGSRSRRSRSARWCPAAIMSIAAANLFTRNIYRDFIKPHATPAQEAKVSKLVSLVVKVGRAGLRARRWTRRSR